MNGIYFDSPQTLAEAIGNVRCFADLGAELIAQQLFADAIGRLVRTDAQALIAELQGRIADLERLRGDGTTSDKYRADLSAKDGECKALHALCDERFEEIAELRAENERLKEGQEKLIFVRDDYKKQAHDYRARWASAIASGNAPAGAIEAIRAEFPLFDDAGLDQETHHCEWSVQNDRKRLHKLLAALKAQPSGVVPAALIEALKYYANGDHLLLADPDAWDTCSGEPINFLHDDAGTASVEDGSIAKAALDSLNSSPVSSGDPEKCSYQGDPRSPAELSLAGCNCVRFGEGNPHWPCKLHTPVSACGVDERAAFEAWYLGHFYMGDKQCGLEWLSTEPCGGYRHQHPAEQWIVWQARAALSPAGPRMGAGDIIRQIPTGYFNSDRRGQHAHREFVAREIERALSPAEQPGRVVAWRITGAGGLTVTPEYPKWAESDELLKIEALVLASAQQQNGVES